jgi:hypothetical protein
MIEDGDDHGRSNGEEVHFTFLNSISPEVAQRFPNDEFLSTPKIQLRADDHCDDEITPPDPAAATACESNSSSHLRQSLSPRMPASNANVTGLRPLAADSKHPVVYEDRGKSRLWINSRPRGSHRPAAGGCSPEKREHSCDSI